MAWGAMFVDEFGTAWATQDAPPMQLVHKQTIGFSNYQNAQALSFSPPSSTPTAIFTCLSSSNALAAITRNGSDQIVVTTKCINDVAFYHEVTVYVFSVQFVNPVPFGINIFDAQGRCTQTNETLVMPQPSKLGNMADPNQSGYMISTTLGGRWAVISAPTGSLSGVVNVPGGVRPFGSQMICAASFDGANTRILSGNWLPVPGGASGINYANMRNLVSVINVSSY